MVTKLSEDRRNGGFLLSEAQGKRSRENVTIVSGQDLQAGAVLGKITSDSKYSAFDNDAGTGIETAAGILLNRCDASEGDVEAAIIARDAEVIGDELVWADTEDDTDKAAGLVDLAALNIRVR